MPPRDDRVTFTPPLLVRERMRQTIQQRGWVGKYGASGELLGEWLLDYFRLKGWDGSPSPVTPLSTEPGAEEASDFGFAED